jgi:hypothetical protein
MPAATRSPTWTDILEAFGERLKREIGVCLPGTVESYDADTQLATVRIDLKVPIRGEDGTDQEAESIPPIANVPVVHPSGGGYFAHFPLTNGDPVVLVIADRSLDIWQEKGGEVDPKWRHTHEITDCFAFPGGRPKPKALGDTPANELVIGKDGGSTIRVKSNGEVHLGQDNPAAFVALADKVDNLISTINTWGATHVHSGVTTGLGSSGTAPTGPFPSGPTSSAATKVKAV